MDVPKLPQDNISEYINTLNYSFAAYIPFPKGLRWFFLMNSVGRFNALGSLIFRSSDGSNCCQFRKDRKHLRRKNNKMLCLLKAVNCFIDLDAFAGSEWKSLCLKLSKVPI